MTKTKKLYFLTLFTFIVIAVVMLINAKINEAKREKLSIDLSNAISQYRNGTTPYLDFSTVTDFSWDRLYIFGPYSSPKQIDATLGAFWLDSRFIDIQTNEDIALLVFTEKGQVIQYLVYPIALGNFAGAGNKTGYGYKEARFILGEYEYMIWLKE